MNPITIASLQAFDAGLEGFTYARYRPLLRDIGQPDAGTERIALGAWLKGTPVGLALLSRPWSPPAPGAGAAAGQRPAGAGAGPLRRLLSIMVHPLVRRSGVGAALLAEAEAAAAAAGTHTVVAVHSSRMGGRAAFEALLRRAGWAAPHAFEHRLAGRPQWALAARADWSRLLQRLVERGYSATDWTTLDDADRQEIRRLVADVLPEADRAFDPLADGLSDAVPELSLLLRRHGRIVGWIRGSRGLAAGAFHYGHGYVLPEVQRLGWLQAGVREVCERQHAMFGPQSLSVFETTVANEAMQRFMARQLGPYRPEWTDTRFSSHKRLG